MECLSTVMPLAGTVGPISLCTQSLTKGDVIVRDRLSCSLNVKQAPPTVQHCPAGHAYRAARTAGNVRVSEGCAHLDQPVDIRGLDLGVAQGLDGVKALVVGEEEYDVHRCT